MKHRVPLKTNKQTNPPPTNQQKPTTTKNQHAQTQKHIMDLRETGFRISEFYTYLSGKKG